MHSLAKKLAIARYTTKEDPFKKDEFPTLKDISIEVVSKNFSLYPELKDVSPPIQEIVLFKS